MAGVSLLVLSLAVFASVGLFVYCLATSRYIAALGLSLAFAAVAAICIRDYRRQRWSLVSGLLVIFWLLLSCAALAYGCWLSYSRG